MRAVSIKNCIFDITLRADATGTNDSALGIWVTGDTADRSVGTVENFIAITTTDKVANWSGDPIEFPVYATAVDASGNAGTLDPSLEFVWTFDENACGATFTPAEGAAEEADIAGKISVSGTGTAAAEVALYLNGEPTGVAKRFTLNAVYQQMAADVDILANDISITGIRYTVGEEKVSLVYQQDGNNLSQEAALGQVKIDYTVSNKAYLDPADVVWSSTDPNSVRVENGTIVFAEDITGPKQVTITVTNLDKTVMDSFLVVVNRAASSSGDEEKGSGCASSMAAVGSAGIAAAALCTALLLLRRKKQG